MQQSTQEAEEALSQGLDALNQSLSDTITSDSLSHPPNMANYMGQMALAMNKLSTLESFVRQVRRYIVYFMSKNNNFDDFMLNLLCASDFVLSSFVVHIDKFC